MQTAKSKTAAYECTEYTEELRVLVQADVFSDEPDVHPQLFRNGAMQLCGGSQRLSPRVFHTATPLSFLPGRNIKTKSMLYTSELYFQVGKHLDETTRGGGRNKRARKNRGWPSG